MFHNVERFSFPLWTMAFHRPSSPCQPVALVRRWKAQNYSEKKKNRSIRMLNAIWLISGVFAKSQVLLFLFVFERVVLENAKLVDTLIILTGERRTTHNRSASIIGRLSWCGLLRVLSLFLSRLVPVCTTARLWNAHKIHDDAPLSARRHPEKHRHAALWHGARTMWDHSVHSLAPS